MAVVGAIAAVVAAGVSVASAISDGSARADAANYNKAIAERNASLSLAEGAENERTFRIYARKQIGTMVAGYGASGVQADASGQDVLASAASEAENDALKIRHSAYLKSIGFESSANLDAMEANASKTGGYLSGAGTLLKSGSGIYRDYFSGGSSSAVVDNYNSGSSMGQTSEFF